MSECKNCGRAECMVSRGRATLNMTQLEFQAAIKQQRKDRADCKANTIDWRERALSLEDKLAVALAKLTAVRSWAVFNDHEPPADVFPDTATFLSVRRGCAQTLLVILDSKETT